MNNYMSKRNGKQIKSVVSLVVLVSIAFVLLSSLASAAKPLFVNVTYNQTFNAIQDEQFFMYAIASDSDNNYPLNFSDTAGSEEVQFYVFKMTNHNDTSAKINFTPTNDDVGQYSFFIFVEDTAEEAEFVKVNFNVSNVNDPPNIT